MTVMQKTTTVKAEVYPEPVADVIEWECPECEQNQKQYTYHIKNIDKLECERCGKDFTIEK